MSYQVRYGTFETNSSSMHSLVITNRDGKYTHDEAMRGIWVRDGEWDMMDDDELEFQRSPFDVLETFERKVRYAIADLCGPLQYDKADRDRLDEQFDEILDIVSKVLPEVEDIHLPTHKDEFLYTKDGRPLTWREYDYDRKTYSYYYEDRNGERQEPQVIEKTYPYYGYVDHASAGLLSSFLEKKGVSLEDFLTDRRYVVIIDGDEYDTWGRIKESGLVSGNIIYDVLDDKSKNAPASREMSGYYDEADEALEAMAEQEAGKGLADDDPLK